MELREAIALIRHPYPGGTWADLGCGSGLFTFALANLLPPESTIYAIDHKPVRLEPLHNPHHIHIIPKQLDFQQEALPARDFRGILLANSLHYVKDKNGLIRQLARHITHDAQFVIVEYETGNANTWVPYPIRYADLQHLMKDNGFGNSHYLGDRPSVFGAAKMYAALFSRM
ncbi:class I SAM-dependent methyltransferase [Chitinophaga sp. Cy-1792]|uniref:class I SAM-dependent methyltransferase n=1 Tax=Chitinophaga sp. Cy-1792 TaxID=2608339 RepID=UPI0014238E9A|nr:class I SAM-dependent methyltransferase [Chitinophaga sp. Cy-1792]NIG56513.1 class I SAM-dependent methyltransferase [Chitinophaga sp. Cy-1792]